MYSKKGLSPVIATTLLVLLAIVLAVLIFLWVKSLVGEKLQKDIGDDPQNIDLVCPQVQFSADAFSGPPVEIYVSNSGNVPIFGAQVLLEAKGKRSTVGIYTAGSAGSAAVHIGQSTKLNYVPASGDDVFASGANLTVVPILLGTAPGDTTPQQYICDREFGISVTSS